jgi:uncharacterized protein (TIGR00725 family)
MNKVCTFFGSASHRPGTLEYNETYLIGKLLGKNGYIVKNGGYRGLMEAISKGASEEGLGNTIGITCLSFGNYKGNDYLCENITAENIFDRLKFLFNENSELSSIFVIQTGGIGTISEFFLLWDVVRKMKNPPKIFLIGYFWKKFLQSVEDSLGFCHSDLFTLCANYEEFEVNFNIIKI